MIRAIAVKAAAHWTGEPADRVMLDYDNRRRRRMTMRGAKGTAFLLDLPTSAALHNGDALVLEDGRLVEVLSAPEPLLEICCSDPEHLARVAWHLGNRHLPTQLLPASLRIRRDHVIAEMAVGLGAQVIGIEAPFEPEGGAYAVTPGHHHRRESEQPDHSHSHGNGHDHGR